MKQFLPAGIFAAKSINFSFISLIHFHPFSASYDNSADKYNPFGNAARPPSPPSPPSHPPDPCVCCPHRPPVNRPIFIIIIIIIIIIMRTNNSNNNSNNSSSCEFTAV